MTASVVRQAQLAVLVNGAPVHGVTKAEVRANAYLCATRFSVDIAYGSGDPVFWNDLPLQVEIQAGLNGVWQSLVSGNADTVSLDPIRQELVLHGRDLTALLIGAETATTFENQTASAIATSIAGLHGLTPVVTPTTDLVGRYYQVGRTRSVLSQHSTAISQWDILTWLANREGFDVWVDGTSLHFQPAASGAASAFLSLPDCTRLRIHRTLDLAEGATVVVKSWDSQQAQTVSGSASGSGSGSGSQAGPIFTALRPNLSAAEATRTAQRMLAQVSTHALEIECDMPGELSLMPRTLLNVSQTGTSFDGVYQITEVERQLSFDRGFTQSLVARGLPWTAS